MTRKPPTLHVEAAHSVLLDGEHEPVKLQVSPRALATRHWPHGRPGPLQLERAIDDVENAIEDAGLRHADRGLLKAAASLQQVLPQRLRSPMALSREDVELEFSRLVAASASSYLDSGFASTGEGAAALLLLREVMHHLGFQALSADN